MAAASAFDLYKTLRPSHLADAAPIHVDSHGWMLLAIGFVVSFFVAWAVVAWFLNWVRHRGFAPFAIYRILLGIGVLIWALR
jgi:undecaprenyl-diphosphatase